MNRPANSRDALLDAAEEIVCERGAAQLSFNTVCARAGVSKGGLLYHFPNKEALLAALLERVASVLAEARQAEFDKLPESPTRELRAHILSAGYFESSRLQGVGLALLAAGAHDTKLLERARQGRAELLEQIQSPALPPALTAVVNLALEGLWAVEISGAYKPSAEERKAIINELLKMVDLVERQQATLEGHMNAPLSDLDSTLPAAEAAGIVDGRGLSAGRDGNER
ncbi:MAG: TetR/AcrR family transcriptional regulator [Candidatus Hydrogenedentes bacterium]|nr:TetR/AcrR family transcriptional regulator [Candidatus Hydrogenedentota bacterium]